MKFWHLNLAFSWKFRFRRASWSSDQLLSRMLFFEINPHFYQRFCGYYAMQQIYLPSFYFVLFNLISDLPQCIGRGSLSDHIMSVFVKSSIPPPPPFFLIFCDNDRLFKKLLLLLIRDLGRKFQADGVSPIFMAKIIRWTSIFSAKGAVEVHFCCSEGAAEIILAFFFRKFLNWIAAKSHYCQFCIFCHLTRS